MKTFGLVIAFLIGSIRAQAASEIAATLRFTTESFDGRYAPQHVMAVWVEDSGGRHVRTLEARGDGHLRHLVIWKRASRKNDLPAADGVTGATLTSHQSHEIPWNGHDAKEQTVPNGDYVFLVEFTEDNGKGRVLKVPFKKGPLAKNQRLPDQKNFKNIELTVAP